MLVPLSWLREFVPITQSVAQLSDAFNSLGLEVEGVHVTGGGLEFIITAEVVAIRPHPNADKIRLVDVRTAEGGAPIPQIACGAWNFSVGDRIPLAPLGTTMPDGLLIERRKLRGEWSNGMLCSAAELKISDDHSGIWILPADTPLGVPIAEAMSITMDAVFDLAVEANRPDAMSIVGVARDLAASLGVAFTMPVIAVLDAPSVAADAIGNVGSITAHDLCDRLTVTVIEGAVVTTSPARIQSRLTAAGMRPINNLVDASNYVMLELGAPSHAFDRAKLAGGHIGVRWAGEGEQLVTLDGVTRILSIDGTVDGVIVDGNDMAVGIAAIMGGATAEVDHTTSTLLLEIAHWSPMAIARSSKRLGLRSEASARFERNSDAELLPAAAARFVQIARLTCPNLRVVSSNDIRPGGVPQPTVIGLRTARVNAVLGTELDDGTVVLLLDRIGFVCVPTEPGVHDVTVPSWRTDCELEINLIEEVGRHFGFDNIARVVPSNSRVGKLTQIQRDRRLIRRTLAAMGVTEAWTATLISPADLVRCGLPATAVALSNPMVAEESVLRTSLLPGILDALRHNANHRNPAVRFFETGHVFEPPRPRQETPYEREHLAVALAGEGDDAASAKRILDALIEALGVVPVAVGLRADDIGGLHPTRSARVLGTGTNFPFGAVGEVDPGVLEAWGITRRVGWLQVDLENLCRLPRRADGLQPFSTFPSSDLDLAIVASDVTPAATIEQALRAAAGDILESIDLFDVYRGPGVAVLSRSLAYRLRFAAADHTLTDTELGEVRQRCIAAAEAAGGQLRS